MFGFRKMNERDKRIEKARKEIEEKGTAGTGTASDKSKQFAACRLCVEDGFPNKYIKSFIYRQDHLLRHIKKNHDNSATSALYYKFDFHNIQNSSKNGERSTA